jgi:hypothetical protein
VSWVETASGAFVARHDERDAPDVPTLLRVLEEMRARLEPHFPGLPDEVAVVLHATAAQLDAAQPAGAALRALTAPAARRYVVGWAGDATIHVLTPQALVDRAGPGEPSRNLLLLAPSALLAQLAVAAANPALRAAVRPTRPRSAGRWAWLLLGAGAYLSGQLPHARPALARRLREGRPPAFPPGLADAGLVGASVLDLLGREEGVGAVVALAREPPGRDPAEALRAAFRGRAHAHTEGTWRAHLARLAGDPPRRRR